MRTTLGHVCLMVTLLFGLISQGVCQTPDPCTTYTPLDDSTLLTTYTDSKICTSMGSPGWYRYNTTIDGTISSVCPNGTQCGTDTQIWMNGTIPSVADGPRNVSLCMVKEGNCCRRQNSMEVKNCTQFIVFRLTSFLPCNRLCFRDSGRPNTTSTSANGTTTILPTNASTGKSRGSSGPRFGLMILFPVSLCVFIGRYR